MSEPEFCGRPGTGECSCAKFGDNPDNCQRRVEWRNDQVQAAVHHPKPIVVVLPYPLSVNRYWMPVKMKNHLSILPTKEGKKYRADAAAICRQHGVAPVKGRVKIELWLYPNRPLDYLARQRKYGTAWDDTVQCQDLDNANKVVLDALKDVLIEDDKWVRQLLAQRMEPDEHGARVMVRISPIVVEQPQGALL